MPDRFVIHLTRLRLKSSNQIQMRSWAKPAAIEHRRRRVGASANHIRFASAGLGSGRLDGNAVFAVHLVAKPAQVRAPGSANQEPAKLAHMGENPEVSHGLSSAAKD